MEVRIEEDDITWVDCGNCWMDRHYSVPNNVCFDTGREWVGFRKGECPGCGNTDTLLDYNVGLIHYIEIRIGGER